ncbi:MAG: hypothetical protein A2174_02550 [Candidatus Portnoybacteria bacterium RBG_13_41_18]|uniref:Aminoglycoside phosphotransferase domain-containing protein n=1 Tax=Candidatus Portnoybacteria bacterium RBG_13_41_18 TaxID=1801991 RepID=A0A1G2F9B6_9BACT|nr:MAG: hypothetical protein A2174_02550 [Candidatus Portnoybacteria bacterium RBG_13_41_18]
MDGISKILNQNFINELFEKKKLLYFPELKNQNIEKVEIERINPDWAKENILAKYKIVFDNGQIKILRGTAAQNGSKENCWRIMKFLERRAFAIPRPIDYLSKINFLLYGEVTGRPLSSIITEKENQTDKLLKKAAAWLSELHALKHQKENLHPAVMTDTNGYMLAFEKMTELFPALKNVKPSETKIKLIGEISAERKTLIHGDFYPNNIISGATAKIYVIDFDRSGLGPALTDLAAQIFWFKSYCQRKIATDFEKIFLISYCERRGLEYLKTAKELNRFLARICLDQAVYFINICLKGWEFFQTAEKNQSEKKIKNLLNLAKSYFG